MKDIECSGYVMSGWRSNVDNLYRYNTIQCQSIELYSQICWMSWGKAVAKCSFHFENSEKSNINKVYVNIAIFAGN